MGLPFREKANSGLPRVFPTSALTRMTSDMAAKAIKKRKASSTVGLATSSASLENMKLMPKMALASRANTSDRVWVFLLCIGFISLSKYGLSYHIRRISATGNIAGTNCASILEMSFRASAHTGVGIRPFDFIKKTDCRVGPVGLLAMTLQHSYFSKQQSKSRAGGPASAFTINHTKHAFHFVMRLLQGVTCW